MAVFNPHMLNLARMQKGISQSEFAERVGVSQGVVSRIEKGEIAPSEVFINGAVEALSITKEFLFYNDFRINAPWSIQFRKKSSTNKKSAESGIASANIFAMHWGILLQELSVNFKPIPELTITEEFTPEVRAREVRNLLGIDSSSPIQNVPQIIESFGIPIFEYPFDEKIDGLTLYAKGSMPVVLVNSRLSPDRFRFTVLHEFAHILFHRVPHENIEDEANRFASEFLMPSLAIKADLENLQFYKLNRLKSYWKVSMSSLIFKASSLGCIDKNRAHYLWVQLSRYGFRLAEPELFEKDKVSLVEKVFKAYQKHEFSKEKLASLLMQKESEFEKMYGDFFPNNHRKITLD